MCRIITTPVEDYLYHVNKREEAKKKKDNKPSTFEDELKIATEKERTNGRTEE